jgi:hypothetical protein
MAVIAMASASKEIRDIVSYLHQVGSMRFESYPH